MTRSCLITGCGGFIGSYLAEYLLENGLAVHGIIHQNRKNIAHLGSRLNVLKCDLLDRDEVESIVAHVKPDFVFHLASENSIPASWQDPGKTLKTNVLGTLNLLDGIRKTGIDPVVEVTGSSAEYGFVTRDEIPIMETRESRPTSPYGVSKAAESMLAYLYWHAYGMRIVRLRPFYVIGPRKAPYACSDFARTIVDIEAGTKQELRVGNLESVRDPVDIRDVVRAMWLLAEEGKPGEVYNICSGREYTIGDVLEIMVALSHQPVRVVADTTRLRSSDEPVLVGDCGKLKSLGWQPQIPIEKSLSDILEYWRENLCDGESTHLEEDSGRRP